MSTTHSAQVMKVARIARQNPADLGMRELVIKEAVSRASTAMDPDKAAECATRVGMAFDAARAGARNPGDFDRCSMESKAQAVADCMVTGLMPGGPMADAWLIPRGGQLTFMPSHRGLQKMANRAGFMVIPVPVHVEDALVTEMGEVVEHTADRRRYPGSLDEMDGIIVRVKDLGTGHILGNFWCPLDVITARKTAKDRRGRAMAGPVWNQWPVEMAMKTAIKWAFARGLVPAQSESITAAIAAESRVIEARHVAVAQAQPRKAIASPSAAFSLDAEPASDVVDVAPEEGGEG